MYNIKKAEMFLKTGTVSYLSLFVPKSPVIWFPTYRRGSGNVCNYKKLDIEQARWEQPITKQLAQLS